jgi:hypothetical protein
MVVACLALLVALGGTGMAAATQLARNTVGTPQLKDAAVSNPKIKNNAVNSAKVAARSLLRSTSRQASCPPGRSARGPPDRRLAQVLRPGRTCRRDRAITDRTASVVVDGGRPRTARTQLTVTSLCSGNERAISGGTDWSTDAAGRELMTGELEPLKNPQGQVTGFLAVGLNDSGTDSTFTVHALCYTPSS